LAVSPDGSDLFLGDCDSSSETGLEALNAATGDPLWRAEQIETRGVSRIAVSSMGDRVAVLAERRTSVAVLDARSGASIWSARYTDEARAADLAFDRSGRTLFVPSRVEDGVGTRVRLTAFRESDGSGEAASARTAP
jgi:outer membrane protein assembly factor BamB